MKFSSIQTEPFFKRVNTKMNKAECAFERVIQAKNDFEEKKIKRSKLFGVFSEEDENLDEILEELNKILAG